jgi:serine/threonine protein kinase
MAKKRPRLDERGREAPSRRERFALDPREHARGGWARVTLGTRREDGRRVAVKELLLKNPESVLRMRREIAIQQRVLHPHVMPIVEADALFEWYAMPIAVGNLEELLPQLSPPEVHRALRHAASGLGAVQDIMHVPHRDVSPRNILALQDPEELRWVVSDWGLAPRLGDESVTLNTRGSIGTPSFCAPEVHDDPRVGSVRSDLYSLGRVAAFIRDRRSWDSHAGLDRFIEATTRPLPQERPVGFDEAILELTSEASKVAPTYLLWSREPSGKTTTRVLRERIDGIEVLGGRAGLFVCDGKRLLQWRETEHDVLMVKEFDYSASKAIQHEAASVEDLDLVDFDTGNSIRISPVEPRDRSDWSEFDRQTVPVAGSGPFLFLKEGIFLYGAGAAHPNRSARFYVVDARNGVEVDSLAPEAWAYWFKEEHTAAVEQHREDASYAADDWELESCCLTFYRPIITPQGATSVELQFSFSAAYAASDDQWSKYTRSRRIQTARLPNELAVVLSPPTALRRVLAQDGEAGAMGWSVVPDVLRSEGWIDYLIAKK